MKTEKKIPGYFRTDINAVPRLTVNVCCYNQVYYIRQCLDGILMQETDFPFVAYVADDASDDGTAEIVKEYADKYPAVIKAFLRDVNTKGKDNYDDNWNRINTEFFANCEGDDYWTDPKKLQLQVDFLDRNPTYSGCIHRNKSYWEEEDKFYDGPEYPKIITKKYLLSRYCPISAASPVYRWRFYNKNYKFTDWAPSGMEPGDIFFHLMHLELGNFGVINRFMSVYRVHKKGLSYGAVYGDENSRDTYWLKCGVGHMLFLKECNKKFGLVVNKKVENTMINTIMSSLKKENFDVLENLIKNYPDDLKKIIPGFEILLLFANSHFALKIVKIECVYYYLACFLLFWKKKKMMKKYSLMRVIYKNLKQYRKCVKTMDKNLIWPDEQ